MTKKISNLKDQISKMQNKNKKGLKTKGRVLFSLFFKKIKKGRVNF
jgi:hypothetical protein